MILVTDGEQRATLALVRSLGRAGFPTFVCGTSSHTLAGSSRFAVASAAVPDALEDPAGFRRAVRGLANRWKVEVLLPVTEPSLLAILAERELFAGLSIPFVDLARFRRISDKQALLAEAPAAGISVPEQRAIATAGEADVLEMSSLRYPVVAKPARSVGEAGGSAAKVGVVHAADASQLSGALARLPPQAYPLLLQQRIVGPGIGIFLLRWNGRTVAAFSHRRIREKPPAGGVSVYRVSIPLDAELLRRSEDLLARFDWQGVAMVEYKLDGATGIPYLMEVNGRFWGSLQLAVDSGVDFPRMLVDLALGREVAPVMTYRTGIRSRWWWGDMDHLLLRMLRSDRRLSLPPGSPGKARALLDFLKIWRPGDRSEIMRLNDPMPFLHESWNWFRNR